MRNTLIGLVLVSSMVAFVGCDQKEAGSALDKAKTAASDAAGAAKDAAGGMADKAKEMVNEAKDKLVAGTETTINELKTKTDALKTKVAALPAEVKPKAEAALADIDKQFEAVKGKLTELKGAGAETWSKMKDELAPMIEKLTGAVKSATDQFGK